MAITSARCVSELVALRSDYSYLQFYPDKVKLCVGISFLPKAVSQFHLSQPLILPSFFPVSFYSSRKDPPYSGCKMGSGFLPSLHSILQTLSLTFSQLQLPAKGLQVTSQKISIWVASTIQLAYQLARSSATEYPPSFLSLIHI